jgi:hypothetical protein
LQRGTDRLNRHRRQRFAGFTGPQKPQGGGDLTDTESGEIQPFRGSPPPWRVMQV